MLLLEEPVILDSSFYRSKNTNTEFNIGKILIQPNCIVQKVVAYPKCAAMPSSICLLDKEGDQRFPKRDFLSLI